MSAVDLSLVVPAYNEAKRIGATLESMRAWLAARGPAWEIVVAADGDDGTREIALGLGAGDPRVVVLGGRERRGKGHGVRRGVARARGRIVGFVDADGKTPIEEMDRLLPWLDDGYDVAVGSRAVAGSRVEVKPPLHRRVGSRLFGLGVRALVGLRGVRDTQCGFKVFRGDVARDLFARQRIDGYMFDVEVLRLAERSGYRVKEVGVRWRDDGDSRLDLIAGNWRNIVDLLRIRLARYPEPSAGACPVLVPGEKP